MARIAEDERPWAWIFLDVPEIRPTLRRVLSEAFIVISEHSGAKSSQQPIGLAGASHAMQSGVRNTAAVEFLKVLRIPSILRISRNDIPFGGSNRFHRLQLCTHFVICGRNLDHRNALLSRKRLIEVIVQ